MSHEPNVRLRFINADKQKNGNDCDLYALAFAQLSVLEMNLNILQDRHAKTFVAVLYTK